MSSLPLTGLVLAAASFATSYGSFALQVTTGTTPEPELLDVPAGWTFERLDLPLGFAPELDYEGFEELAFAPGMFTPASPDHWSYALALRLAGDVAIDRAWLEHFFTRYYRGLCAAVGSGRGFELDLDAIVARAGPGDAPYVLKTELRDVFADGAPLALTLEIDVHASATHTELFGLASPASADAPIWSELGAIHAAWRAEQPAPVVLNHVFWVPDRTTYDALVSSEELRRLAVSEERTTVRQDLTYTGLYVYGQRTYFEFLEPGGDGPLGPGATGIAFGHEDAGGRDRFAAALASAGVRTFAGTRTRALDGDELPWFEILGVEAAQADQRLSLFSMEYRPEFLRSWHADRAPASGATSSRRRAAVLERYAASLGRTAEHDTAALLDVTAVHLELDERERARFAAVARAAGWDVPDLVDGRLVVSGPEVRFLVTASDEPGGVIGFDVRLRDDAERAPLELGSLRVTFDGPTARFRFDGGP